MNIQCRSCGNDILDSDVDGLCKGCMKAEAWVERQNHKSKDVRR